LEIVLATKDVPAGKLAGDYFNPTRGAAWFKSLIEEVDVHGIEGSEPDTREGLGPQEEEEIAWIGRWEVKITEDATKGDVDSIADKAQYLKF